jgi:hypothetical protein
MVIFDGKGWGSALCADMLNRLRRNRGTKPHVSHGKRSVRRPEIQSVRGGSHIVVAHLGNPSIPCTAYEARAAIWPSLGDSASQWTNLP